MTGMVIMVALIIRRVHVAVCLVMWVILAIFVLLVVWMASRPWPREAATEVGRAQIPREQPQENTRGHNNCKEEKPEADVAVETTGTRAGTEVAAC